MLGSLLKAALPERLGVDRKDLVVVSVMPCTAKKAEAKLDKFLTDGRPDVDHVITTVELARMIQSAGLRFADLQPESFDMPFGFTTGAGVLFGASGGVTEAVLRFAAEKLAGKPLARVDFAAVRGQGGMREASVEAGGATLRVVVVHGLRNARMVAEQVKAGRAKWDIIEVMACPGGCIGGAGQPVNGNREARTERAKGLYQIDKMLQLQKSQDNMFVTACYERILDAPGGRRAHELLHTRYQSRRRTADEDLTLLGAEDAALKVNVCLGTNCFVKGSEKILRGLLRQSEEQGLEGEVDIRASFCCENCEHGPTVNINGQRLDHCTPEIAAEAVERELSRKGETANDNGNAMLH
jgi:NADH-quinone oxidoreductase subunit G